MLTGIASAQSPGFSTVLQQPSRTQIALTLAQADKGYTNAGTRLVIQATAANAQFSYQPQRPTTTVLEDFDFGTRRVEVLTVAPGFPSAYSYRQTNYISRIIVVDDRVAGITATNLQRFYKGDPGVNCVIIPGSALQRRPIEVLQITVPSLR